MKDLTPLLQSLGLTNSEIKTYLSVLEAGPGTIVEISQQTKVSRQATYSAVNSLILAGLMSSVLRGKKRLYAAEPPQNLAAYAERRTAELADVATQINTLVPELTMSTKRDQPVVKLFEGKEGLKAVIGDITTSLTKNLFELTDAKALRQVLSKTDLAPFVKQITKNKTVLHGLYSETAPETQLSTTQFKLEDKYSNFKADIELYDNKIVFMTFEHKMYSIIIENKPIAEAMRILFDLAFENMKNKK